MRKTATLGVLLLTAAVLLAGASIALADGDISGHWTGTWTCTATPEIPCDKPGGNMEGNLTQQGNTVTGTFTMHNTVVGDLNCSCAQGVLVGNQFSGVMDCVETSATFNATINNSNAQGTFTSSDMGGGTFDISR